MLVLQQPQRTDTPPRRQRTRFGWLDTVFKVLSCHDLIAVFLNQRISWLPMPCLRVSVEEGEAKKVQLTHCPQSYTTVLNEVITRCVAFFANTSSGDAKSMVK